MTSLVTCPVCFEDLNKKMSIKIPCCKDRHEFCLDCVINLQTRKCPLCRQDFEKFIPIITPDARKTLMKFLEIYE